MPRRPADPQTRLGAAIQAARGDISLRATATALEIDNTTISRIERGRFVPSTSTARVLARYLGWTVEQVLDAAETPADRRRP